LEKPIRTLQSKVDQLIFKDAEKKRKEAMDKLITKGGGDKVVAKNDKGRQSPQVSPYEPVRSPARLVALTLPSLVFINRPLPRCIVVSSVMVGVDGCSYCLLSVWWLVEFSPLTRRTSGCLWSNFWELSNHTEAIELGVGSGRLQDCELFIYTDNSTAKAAYYKGNSDSRELFELVVRL
jgi:hypothetical protein